MNRLFCSLIFALKIALTLDCQNTIVSITIPASAGYIYTIGEPKEYSETFPITYTYTTSASGDDSGFNACTETYDVNVVSTTPAGLKTNWINKN
jgi:hypothetical protein